MFYDFIVIGIGLGGYVVVIWVVQFGFKIVVVEKCKIYGGICLNIGCILLKVLFYVLYMFYDVQYFVDMGIGVSVLIFDFKKMFEFKQEGVDGNIKGVEFLFKKNKIDVFIGMVWIVVLGQVEVMAEDGLNQVFEVKNIVIVMGFDVICLLGIEIDEKVVVFFIGVFDFEIVLKCFVVIGVGVIGFEFGFVWCCFGFEVMVVEYFDCILFGMDGEVVKNFQCIFGKQGFVFKFGVKVIKVEWIGNGVMFMVEFVVGGLFEMF